MKALSIQQPWAWLILHAGKDIENRSWPTAVRGRILIHAGQTLDRDAAEALWRGEHPVTGRPWTRPVPRDFLRGGIVGSVEIRGCVERHESEWFMGKHGFVLHDPQPLPFHRCRGMLGFFPVDLSDTPAAPAPAQGSLL